MEKKKFWSVDKFVAENTWEEVAYFQSHINAINYANNLNSSSEVVEEKELYGSWGLHYVVVALEFED